jgi:hypothetical protein
VTSSYSVLAYWGPRRELPEECAPKLLQTLKALSEIDPALGYWIIDLRRGKPVLASSLDVDAAARWLIKGQNRSEVHHLPIPEFGYRFYASNQATSGPRHLAFDGSLGAYTKGPILANNICLATESLEAANSDIINFRTFESVLNAFVTIWNPTWCQAVPTDLLSITSRVDRVRHRPRLGGGWITYLAAPFAQKIVPPRSAKCEALNGGILMVATEETFLADNPEHVAIARDIDSALAPFNALPWPPDGATQ